MQVSNQYWAGFFDGEGHITLIKYFSEIYKQKFVVAVRVVVTQKEPMVLYLLQKSFGGSVRVSPKITPSGFKTSIGRWQCDRAEDVFVFLSAIKSYCIVKAVETSVALEILDGIMKSKDNYVRNKDERGIPRFAGKTPIELSEIQRRQLLELKFNQDRIDGKEVEVVAKIKSKQTPIT